MNVSQVVPFFAVKQLQASVAFYVDGLGFSVVDRWVDEGVWRWCRLRLDGAALMLQQYRSEGDDARHFSDSKGEGVSLHFECDDAIALYRSWSGKGLAATEPQVSNSMWVTSLTDPDGYSLFFQSPTDTLEDTRLADVP